MPRWLLLGSRMLLPLAIGAATTARAQTAVELPSRDRVRLAESMRLAAELGDRIWPGWGRTAMPVLLVGDSVEFLIGHPRPSAEFARLGYDTLLLHEVWIRPRQFSPGLLATFPAVGGISTIVIGSAEHTGKSSTPWVLTILHEHFHQWQNSRPDYYAGVKRLDLARGDTTGMWMLDYPFPYDSAPVQEAMHRLAATLLRALNAPPGARAEAMLAVIEAGDSLRSRLSPADHRYFEFQLWQEGVARFIEHATARAAAASGRPPAAFRSLPDYQPYAAAAAAAREHVRRELDQMALPSQRRVAFYPLGAAMAMLLEETRPDWKRVYAARPFALTALLSGTDERRR
jgi:hypothetical protein